MKDAHQFPLLEADMILARQSREVPDTISSSIFSVYLNFDREMEVFGPLYLWWNQNKVANIFCPRLENCAGPTGIIKRKALGVVAGSKLDGVYDAEKLTKPDRIKAKNILSSNSSWDSLADASETPVWQNDLIDIVYQLLSRSLALVSITYPAKDTVINRVGTLATAMDKEEFKTVEKELAEFFVLVKDGDEKKLNELGNSILRSKEGSLAWEAVQELFYIRKDGTAMIEKPVSCANRSMKEALELTRETKNSVSSADER